MDDVFVLQGLLIGIKMLNNSITNETIRKNMGIPQHFATFTSAKDRHLHLERYVQDIRNVLHRVAKLERVHIVCECFVGEQLERKKKYGISCPDIHVLLSYEYGLDDKVLDKIALRISDLWWILFGCSLSQVDRFDAGKNWLEYCFKHDKHYASFSVCSARPTCRRGGCYIPKILEE